MILKIGLQLYTCCGYISSNASFQIFRSHVIGMNSIMMTKCKKKNITDICIATQGNSTYIEKKKKTRKKIE